MHKTPRKLAALLLVAMAALVSLPAAAHPRGHGERVHDGRWGNQQSRIHDGRWRGELTRAELKKIRRQQERIAKMERRALRDGVLTRREQRRLHEARQDLSRLIYREKNDRQRRS